MQNWKKSGLIYACKHKGALPFYAAVPFAKHLKGDVFRIYFSARNTANQSYISYFDFNIINKTVIADDKPVLLQAGSSGAFDDAGTVLFQILSFNDQQWLFYSGWTREVKVPFRFNIGLAKAMHASESYIRYSEGPVIGQTMLDPYMAGAPFIIIENGIWRMWYVSCLGWKVNGIARHFYHIKYTYSDDGVKWFNQRITAIDFKDEKEFAIARPVVLHENNIYKMWYSYRGLHYKIGYAESNDGITWQRKDEEVNLELSATGWDSEMICYGFIFDHNDSRYMLYNGNGYGKSGIGLATLGK